MQIRQYLKETKASGEWKKSALSTSKMFGIIHWISAFDTV